MVGVTARRALAGPWAGLLLAALGWAAYSPVSKHALAGGFAPLTLMSVQLAAATGVLAVIAWWRGWGRTPPWPHTAARALLEPVGNVGLFLAGLAHLAAVDGSLLLAVEGLLTAGLGALLLRERLRRATWTGLVVGGVGLWLLLGSLGNMSASTGGTLVLAGVACSALYSVWTAHAMRGDVDVVATTTTQMGSGLLVIAPIAVTVQVMDSPLGSAPIGPGAWTAAVAGGLLLGVPSLLFNRAVAVLPVGETALLLNLIPVLGAGLGVVFLGEPLSLMQLVGGLVTLIGVALVTRSR